MQNSQGVAAPDKRPGQAMRRQNYFYLSAELSNELAMQDLKKGLLNWELWWSFAVNDIKQRFRRSVLGPFWLTISMGVMVAALGLVFGTIFRQDIKVIVPYIATGIIFWGLISSTITEGCSAFIAGEQYIRNVPMPISSHFYRIIARNLIIWLHNMVIYLLVFLIFSHQFSLNYLYFLPGFVILMVNISWMALIAGIISTRFRDIPQVIISLLTVVFMVTPVFWSVAFLPNRPAFVTWNPFYSLIEIVRSPLLGNSPQPLTWVVAIGLIIIGIPATILLYRKAFARIPYWV